MKKLVTIAISVALLSGCTATSVKELKNDSAYVDSFKVEQNYQRVYKNLNEKMQECIHEGWAGVFASMHLKQDIYSELREADISYMMTNFGMKSYYMHVDIDALEADSTEVSTHVFHKSWMTTVPLIKQWINNPKSSCDLESKLEFTPSIEKS